MKSNENTDEKADQHFMTIYDIPRASFSKHDNQTSPSPLSRRISIVLLNMTQHHEEKLPGNDSDHTPGSLHTLQDLRQPTHEPTVGNFPPIGPFINRFDKDFHVFDLFSGALKHKSLAVSPRGLKELWEACRKHLHLSWNLSDCMVQNYDPIVFPHLRYQ